MVPVVFMVPELPVVTDAPVNSIVTLLPSAADEVVEPKPGAGAVRLPSPRSPSKNMKKPAKATVQRSSSTLSQQSFDMADQASMAAKRTLPFEQPLGVSGTSRGPVQVGLLGLMKKGRYNPAPTIPNDDSRRKEH